LAYAHSSAFTSKTHHHAKLGVLSQNNADASRGCTQISQDMSTGHLCIVVEASTVDMLFVVAAGCEEAQWIEALMSRL